MTWQIEPEALASWAIDVIRKYSRAELDLYIRRLLFSAGKR